MEWDSSANPHDVWNTLHWRAHWYIKNRMTFQVLKILGFHEKGRNFRVHKTRHITQIVPPNTSAALSEGHSSQCVRQERP